MTIIKKNSIFLVIILLILILFFLLNSNKLNRNTKAILINKKCKNHRIRNKKVQFNLKKNRIHVI